MSGPLGRRRQALSAWLVEDSRADLTPSESAAFRQVHRSVGVLHEDGAAEEEARGDDHGQHDRHGAPEESDASLSERIPGYVEREEQLEQVNKATHQRARPRYRTVNVPALNVMAKGPTDRIRPDRRRPFGGAANPVPPRPQNPDPRAHPDDAGPGD